MSTVEELLHQYVNKHRAAGTADPAPFLNQVSGVDRAELAAHIDRYLAEVPPPAYDPASFARFRSDPAREALVRRIVDDTSVRELRRVVGFSLASVGERLAAALGLVGREQRVKGRYHDIEFGVVDPADVSSQVWSALGELFKTSPDRLRSIAAATFASRVPTDDGVIFARATPETSRSSSRPVSTTADDTVDAIFFVDRGGDVRSAGEVASHLAPTTAGMESRQIGVPQMALSPLINVPIARQDTTMDVVRKGDGSHEFDEVVVTTTIDLSGAMDSNEVTLLLPLAGKAQQKPLLRWTEDDPAVESVSFDPVERSVFDQAVADALADFQDDDRKEREKLAKAIKDAAKGGISQAVLTVKPDQRQLRFFYTIAAFRQEDGSFTFDVLGPLASFVLQTGGSLSAIALLARGTTLVEAHGYSDPANLAGEITTEQATVAQRTLLGWYYQNDPLFRVTYR